MKTNLTSFIKKWNGKCLQDDGCYVSKEFHSFQVSFFNAMRKIAKTLNAELVKPSYGHYDMSGFIKKDNKFVYFNYGVIGYRTKVILKPQGTYSIYNGGGLPPMYVRTAKSDTDYRGGANNNCHFIECEEIIERLLNN